MTYEFHTFFRYGISDDTIEKYNNLMFRGRCVMTIGGIILLVVFIILISCVVGRVISDRKKKKETKKQ